MWLSYSQGKVPSAGAGSTRARHGHSNGLAPDAWGRPPSRSRLAGAYENTCSASHACQYALLAGSSNLHTISLLLVSHSFFLQGRFTVLSLLPIHLGHSMQGSPTVLLHFALLSLRGHHTGVSYPHCIPWALNELSTRMLRLKRLYLSPSHSKGFAYTAYLRVIGFIRFSCIGPHTVWLPLLLGRVLYHVAEGPQTIVRRHLLPCPLVPE